MTTTVRMTGPGTTTIKDDAATEITAQTAAITKTMTANTAAVNTRLSTMDAALNQINNNLSALVEQSKLISKAISDLEVTASVSVAGQSSLNALQATAIANQIKTNNFQTAATKEALARTGQPAPILPTFDDQIKEGISDAINLNLASTAQGAGVSFINSTITNTATLIAGTEVYKTVGGWLNRQKNLLVSAIIPPTPRQVASNVAAATGVKSIPSA
jgi:hypothetical protein